MSLVIEDGTEVASAQSYVTAAEVTAYATQRGIVLPSVADAAVEILIHKAMDLVESLESRFQGARVTDTQVLSWPRKEVSVNGFPVPETTIPALLKKALCQLATDAASIDLMPNGDGKEVIEEKVDVLSTKYAERGVTAPQPHLTAFYAIVDPLLRSGGLFNLELSRTL
jgi:hypothetical protein